MNIIDSHAHLDHLENPKQALADAAAAGVSDIIAVSVDLEACKKNLALQEKFQSPKIHVALGIHPGNIKAEEVDQTIEFIRQNINKAIAIGECGLDYWYKWVRKDREKKDEQMAVFQKHLDLANEFDLPIIIHTRGTWKHALEMAEKSGVKKALFHWYSGPLDILDKILANGYYVSTSPSVAYSPQSREAMSHAPIERTLIETDTPVSYRTAESEERFQSEPKDVVRTLKAYAALKEMKEEEALEILNQNARSFFNLN